nr:hypothetical protein [Salmonella enterica]
MSSRNNTPADRMACKRPRLASIAMACMTCLTSERLRNGGFITITSKVSSGWYPRKSVCTSSAPVLRTLSFFTARNRSSFNSIPVINASGAASFKAFRMRPSPNSGSRTRSPAAGSARRTISVTKFSGVGKKLNKSRGMSTEPVRMICSIRSAASAVKICACSFRFHLPPAASSTLFVLT